MRKLLLLFLIVITSSVHAQVLTNPNGVVLTPQTSASGNLTAVDSSTNCTTTNACVTIHLPINANALAVQLSGTFSATETFRMSINNQISWVTQSTSSSTGITTFPLSGQTDFQVQTTAFTSGTVAVAINVSLNTGPAGPSGPAGSGGSGGATDPNSTYAINFGAKFNGKMFTSQANTCSWTLGQATFTCTGANFTSADIGKQVSATINSANGVGDQYVGTLAFANAATTIASVQSSTQATISQNFTQNSGADWIIVWATNDDAALTAAETAWAASNNCGNLQLPAGITAVLQPHFGVPGANCLGIEPQSNYTASVNGQSEGSTIVGVFPGFNFAGCTANSNSCFGGYKEANWSNFQFNGFGWGNTGAGSAKTLIGFGLGSQALQFACIGLGGSDINLTGVNMSFGARAWGLVVDGCGNVGAVTSGATLGAIQCHYCFFGDTKGPNLEVNTGSTFCYGCEYGGTGGTVLIELISSISDFHQIGGSVFACTGPNETGIYSGASGGTITLMDTNYACTGSGSNGIYDAGNNTTIHLIRSSVGGVSRNIGAATQPAAVYIDDQSQLTGLGTNPVPSCTFTSGGGTTPSCAVESGSRNERGTIIATTGSGAPGSTGTVTLTFYGTAFAGLSGGARACHFSIDNSATAWGNEATAQTNAQSTTTPIVAWANVASGVLTALTASVPYRIDYSC